MSRIAKTLWAAVALLAAVLAVLALGGRRASESALGKPAAGAVSQEVAVASHSKEAPVHASSAGAPDEPVRQGKLAAAGARLLEDGGSVRGEEASVDAFYALTDRWMKPSQDGVTMKDVDDFCAQFKKVPADRKDECIHRALNLVPDENIMLLAGILMDKTQGKELVELVYNDVLNRSEDVKKPILQQIFKDRAHPCWAQTAWILEATGELPAKK